MNKRRISICTALMTAGMMVFPSMAENQFDTSDMKLHKIGVIVYNTADDQVVAFRDYLENYIELCFMDVDFVYSGSVTTQEQEMEFIQNACDAGVEGILSFNSYDLEAEVSLCEQNQVYYLRASSGITDEDYEKVADNPYFLGAIGPNMEMEYQAGYEMGSYFANQKIGDSYFIPSGGAGFGVQSHIMRTKGILDALQEVYEVSFQTDADELAASPVSVTAEAGNLTVCVAPGFLDSDMFLPAVEEAYEQGDYDVVLSVYPISNLKDAVKEAEMGVIDCYSVTNMQLFQSGSLDYLAGKFSSSIGPSFAVMYNAVTGYAEDFREDGKAFRIDQGYWTSDSEEDFMDKYTLSSSIVMNAYNAEDLLDCFKLINPDASLKMLKELAEAYTFEDAKKRRDISE